MEASQPNAVAPSIKIIADGREKMHVSDHLKVLVANCNNLELIGAVQIVGEEEGHNLSIGDYYIEMPTTKFALERKSIQDFRNSFLEKKLFIQLDDLFKARSSGQVQHIGLLLEGEWPNNIDEYSQGYPTWSAINTMITQLSMRGMPVFKSDSPVGTALNIFSCINVLWKRNTAKEISKPVQTVAGAKMEQKITTIAKEMGVREDWMYGRSFLELFHGVSKERAESIITRFNFSLASMVEECKRDKVTFKAKVRECDGIKFKMRLPEKTADDIIRILSL